MLVINKEGIEALIERLKFNDEIDSCKAELKQMLEIKEVILWRTEARSCCNIPWELQSRLNYEIQLFKKAIEAFEVYDREKAAELLHDIADNLIEE